MRARDDLTRSTEVAWDVASEKYEPDVESDVAMLARGEVSLTDVELRVLGDLGGCALAVCLQCSHGADALSLLNLGASKVIGLDISWGMLAQAQAKSERLGVNAEWIHADVLDPPARLFGTADLVFTGKGSLCWVADIGRWSEVIARLLAPGGRLVVHEAHPLNALWHRDAKTHVVRADRDYFDVGPRQNDDFPASAIDRLTPSGDTPPIAWEYQWGLGAIVTALSEAGLRVARLEEHGELWWPQFPEIPTDEMVRLPHMFTLVAER